MIEGTDTAEPACLARGRPRGRGLQRRAQVRPQAQAGGQGGEGLCGRGRWRRAEEDGGWHPFREGRYSVNAWDLEKGKRSYRFRTAWNGGIAEDETGPFYFMVSGGAATRPEVENPSTHAIPRSRKAPDQAPLELVKATMKRESGQRLSVTWETASGTLPQFGYTLEALAHPDGRGEPVAEVSVIDPSARKATLALPEAWGDRPVQVRLTCRDLLDHEVERIVRP